MLWRLGQAPPAGTTRSNMTGGGRAVFGVIAGCHRDVARAVRQPGQARTTRSNWAGSDSVILG
eukprot:15295819-Alexandrium_andersonii.AAC.1